MRLLNVPILLVLLTFVSCVSSGKSLRNTRFGKKSPKAKTTTTRNTPTKPTTFAVSPTSPREASTFFREWKGTPYKYGGTTKAGVDCSALVLHFYADIYRLQLKRVTRDQYKQGIPVSKQKLQFGDLVFFKNSRKNAPVDHVGVYAGNGRFFHASTSRGATFSNLSDSYYKARYVGARRLVRN